MNMEKDGNSYTCLDTQKEELEIGSCRWKRRMGIRAGLCVHQ